MSAKEIEVFEKVWKWLWENVIYKILGWFGDKYPDNEDAANAGAIADQKDVY